MVSSVGSVRRPAAILAAPMVATLFASMVIACMGGAGASPTQTVLPTEPGTRPSGPVSIPPSGAPEPGAVPDALLATIVADAAGLAGVDPADVIVVSTEAVTWNDGSLGCPKPGVMYIQQIIQGYRVVVEAGGQRFDYRAGSSGEPKRCEGSLPVGGSG
jgi:hypothetical protein